MFVNTGFTVFSLISINFALPDKRHISMFENLSERLESAFKQLKGEGRINEINVASTGHTVAQEPQCSPWQLHAAIARHLSYRA